MTFSCNGFIGEHFSAFNVGKTCTFVPIKTCHMECLYKKLKKSKIRFVEHKRENMYQWNFSRVSHKLLPHFLLFHFKTLNSPPPFLSSSAAKHHLCRAVNFLIWNPKVCGFFFIFCNGYSNMNKPKSRLK